MTNHRIPKSHHLFEHARQSDDSLLRRVEVLQKENEDLQERLLIMQKAVAPLVAYPDELELTPRESQVVSMLLERPLVTKEACMSYLYSTSGADDIPGEKIVDVWIHKVRVKIQRRLPLCVIATRWGQGYYMPSEAKKVLTAYLMTYVDTREKITA